MTRSTEGWDCSKRSERRDFWWASSETTGCTVNLLNEREGEGRGGEGRGVEGEGRGREGEGRGRGEGDHQHKQALSLQPYHTQCLTAGPRT